MAALKQLNRCWQKTRLCIGQAGVWAGRRILSASHVLAVLKNPAQDKNDMAAGQNQWYHFGVIPIEQNRKKKQHKATMQQPND